MAWPLKYLKQKTLFNFLFTYSLVFGELSYAKEFQKKKIELAQKVLIVEVAETPEQLAFGLMFRQKLGPDEGMLFVFSEEAPRSFWMKNTLIDLSIGFFDRKRKLIDVKEMKSGAGVPDQALPSYISAHPAKYALEMSKGWFDKNKIRIGERFNFK
jgi:uncharacterized membrane protein (UPF0127 family)